MVRREKEVVRREKGPCGWREVFRVKRDVLEK